MAEALGALLLKAVLQSSDDDSVSFRAGDRVKVGVDLDTFKEKQKGHGGWASGMENCLYSIGKVEGMDRDGDVQVSYSGGKKWCLNPDVLTMLVESSDGLIGLGDAVKVVVSGASALRELQRGHGGFSDGMEDCVQAVGRVEKVDSDKDVVVRFATGKRWCLNPSVLRPATAAESHSCPVIGVGDAVRSAIQAQLPFRQIQESHGGWNDNMMECIHKVGQVVGVLKSGDLRVRYVSGRVWTLNPAALNRISD